MEEAQELMEPRVGGASVAARLRGWTTTLELLEQGELSTTELDAIISELLRAASECDARLKSASAAEETEEMRLLRVQAKVMKALKRRLRALGLRC